MSWASSIKNYCVDISRASFSTCRVRSVVPRRKAGQMTMSRSFLVDSLILKKHGTAAGVEAGLPGGVHVHGGLSAASIHPPYATSPAFSHMLHHRGLGFDMCCPLCIHTSAGAGVGVLPLPLSSPMPVLKPLATSAHTLVPCTSLPGRAHGFPLARTPALGSLSSGGSAFHARGDSQRSPTHRPAEQQRLRYMNFGEFKFAHHILRMISAKCKFRNVFHFLSAAKRN